MCMSTKGIIVEIGSLVYLSPLGYERWNTKVKTSTFQITQGISLQIWVACIDFRFRARFNEAPLKGASANHLSAFSKDLSICHGCVIGVLFPASCEAKLGHSYKPYRLRLLNDPSQNNIWQHSTFLLAQHKSFGKSIEHALIWIGRFSGP